VGDLGDEDLPLVERLAGLSCEKAVLLGNHDAWHSMFGQITPRFRAQLARLGADHLGYAARPVGEIALVGARPFTWGGSDWRRFAPFYRELYGVEDDDASAGRIAAAAASLPDRPVVVLAHNGPKGLGEGREAIYGRDFRRPFDDFGDPDLTLALEVLRERDGRAVPFVVAGHMHHLLRGGGLRQRVVVDPHGTVHVNAAVVPRHAYRGLGRVRHHVRLVVESGRPALAEDVWVDDDGAVVERHRLHEAEP
jgi:uncharacterized protein (TIGR04168 family)